MTLSIALAAPLAALQMTSPPTEAGAFYWADFNADGHTDAYVVLPEGEARLLAGKGEGAFSDITLEAGLDRVRGVHQIAWADLDGDRRLDLFLASYTGKSRVLLQQEGGSFAPVHDDRGLWADSRPLDVRALDLDGDQRADLQLITPEGDVLLRSLGGGAFERLELGFRTIAPETDLSGLNVGRARAEAGLPDVGPDRPTMEKSTNPGIGVRSTPPAPGTVPFCPPSVQDVATGNCIPASSVPMFGALYPLGNEFFIDAATGFVGIGKTNPVAPLDVAGDIRTSGAMISAASTGAPLVVQSQTKVDNLNADLLDGFSAEDFSQLGNQIETNEIADLTITNTDIASNAAIAGTKVDPSFGTQTVVAADASIAGEVAAFTLDALDTIESGYGSETSPSFTFDPNEPTGLSSPFVNTLNVIVDGLTRMKFEPSGKISVEDPGSVSALDNSLGMFIVGRYGNPYPGLSASAAIVGESEVISGGAYGLIGRAIGGTSVGESVGVRAYGGTHGVYADVLQFGSGSAVFGHHPGENTTGVLGEPLAGVFGRVVQNADELTSKAGVEGIWIPDGQIVPAVAGAAVRGDAFGNGIGVLGVNTFPDSYGVFSTGNFGATGVKNFVAPNPADPSTEIRFVCLEGNEAGTYFRGSTSLEGGVAVIDVPEEFRHVTDEAGMTVQVTPNGPSMVWVESFGLDQIVVRGSADVDFFYFVNGVRRGFRDVDIVAPNRSYRPTEVGLPFGEGLAPEVRQILVENGTLNPDFTPNLATASELGWKLDPAGTEAARRAAREQRPELLPEALPEPTSAPEVRVRRSRQ